MYSEYRKREIVFRSQFLEDALDVMIIGATGAGKSTTLNALLGRCAAKVGYGADPETMNLDEYYLNEFVRFWDTPGLGDDYFKDKQHAKKIASLIHRNCLYCSLIDLVLIILEGGNRDMNSTFRLINEVLIPNSFPRDKILVAINKCDAVKPRHWNKEKNAPDEKLSEFLNAETISVKRRIFESTGVKVINPIYYSGECGYNLNKLMDLIIDNMPSRKRPLKFIG